MSSDDRSSLGKGLAVLQALSRTDHPLTISEIASEAGVNRATVYRICETLQADDWLAAAHSGSNRKRVDLGPAALGFAMMTTAKLGIEESLQPLMDRLANRIGETVHGGHLEGASIIHVARALPSEGAHMALPMGTSVDAHVTGLGKALLATLPREEVLARYPVESLTPYTAKTLRTRTELLDRLDEIRRLGYSYDDEESGIGVSCIAAPVFGTTGNAVLALSATTMPVRLEGERFDTIAREVVDTATQATHALGGEVPEGWGSPAEAAAAAGS